MVIQKVDYKREHKELYAATRMPAMVEVPELSFLMIDGSGDPNTSTAFQEAVGALYSVSYGLKFASKNGPAGMDYVVMPLEGLWSDPTGDEGAWRWTLMIMQPGEITQEMVAQAVRDAAARKPLPAAPQLRFERFAEGLAAQVLHMGPYDQEEPTIDRLMTFIAEQGYEPAGRHHEIYLSDPSRAAPEKLKTIIRHAIAP